MGYDYSRQFLDAHAETVNQLTELYNTFGVTSIAFDTQADLERVQLRISNVLASLAFNFPKQYTGLRERVRTWTGYDADKQQWILYVGSPRHKVAGRRPGMLPAVQVQQQYGTAAQSGREEESYGKLVSNKEEWEEFVRYMAAVGPATRTVRVELADPPDNINFLRVFKSIGWRGRMESPTTVVLRKRQTRPDGRPGRDEPDDEA